RELRRGHRPVSEVRGDPFEDRRVDQALGLELPVAATDELLGRLVEVGEHVLDHTQRLAPAEGRGPRQMINKFVVHPTILKYRGPLRKNSARYRAGMPVEGHGWPTCAGTGGLHALEDRLLRQGELLLGQHPGPVQVAPTCTGPGC